MMVKLISRTVQYIVLLYFIKVPRIITPRTQKYLIFRIHKSTVSYCLCQSQVLSQVSGEKDTEAHKYTSVLS